MRIPNAVVSIGDIVSKINGISLENKNTKEASLILASSILSSLQFYSQNQWRAFQRISRSLTNHSQFAPIITNNIQHNENNSGTSTNNNITNKYK